MQISLQHTPTSIREAQRMQTPGWRRGLRGLRYARLLIYGVVGLWVGGGLVLHGLRADPQNMQDVRSGLLLLLLIAVVCGIFVWRSRSTVTRSLTAQVPATLDLTAAGLSVYQSTGQNAFEPWSAFTSFREGKRTVLLARQGKAAPMIIPIGALDDASRGALRSMLLSQLPERG